MSKESDIQWCDGTVNPTTGCDGCELWVPGKGGPCYAGNCHERRMAKSLPQLYAADFNEVRLVPGRMAKAARWSDLTGTDRPDKPWLTGRPRVNFVGDMGDVFSAAVPFEYLAAEVVGVARSAAGARHVWMVLTKQAARLAEFSAWLAARGVEWPGNVWPGVSVTRQATVARVAHLTRVGGDGTVRFVSAEPLLERVTIPMHGLSLVIVGGESGPGARTCDTSWVRSIVRQCKLAGVAAFVKQMGANAATTLGGQPDTANGTKQFPIRLKDKKGGEPAEWPEDLRVREFPETRTAAAR